MRPSHAAGPMPPLMLLWMFLAIVPALSAPAAGPDGDDPAYQSAVLLLRQCMDAAGRGETHLMLRALRHLKDPALRPLFADLADRTEPLLRVHGLLGLAETAPDGLLDLGRVAALDDEMVLGQVVGAALDDELLTLDQARQMLAWSDLPLGVKIVLATRLVAAQDADGPAAREAVDRNLLIPLLEQAASQGPLGQRGLAAVLLVELQEEGAMDLLTSIDRSEDVERTLVRTTLLKTAMRLGYRRIGPWALWISTEQTEPIRLRLLALQTALRFNAPRADDAWKAMWYGHSDTAMRRRLAILRLQVAPWVDPAMFDLMDQPPANPTDPLLDLIARAGRSIANADGAGVEQEAALTALAAVGQPLVNAVLISYAERHAPLQTAAPMLWAIIKAADGPELARAERLEQAIEAARVLGSLRSADALAEAGGASLAAQVLPNHAEALKADHELLAAVLLGLVRCDNPAAYTLGDRLPAGDQPLVRSLKVLLRARAAIDEPRALDEADMRQLSLLVRGGGGFDQTLRLQGAWLYLKHAGRVKNAFDALLPPGWTDPLRQPNAHPARR